MEIEELIRKCKAIAITLEEGKKSKVTIGDIMKCKKEKASGWMSAGKSFASKRMLGN